MGSELGGPERSRGLGKSQLCLLSAWLPAPASAPGHGAAPSAFGAKTPLFWAKPPFFWGQNPLVWGQNRLLFEPSQPHSEAEPLILSQATGCPQPFGPRYGLTQRLPPAEHSLRSSNPPKFPFSHLFSLLFLLSSCFSGLPWLFWGREGGSEPVAFRVTAAFPFSPSLPVAFGLTPPFYHSKLLIFPLFPPFFPFQSPFSGCFLSF